MKCVLSYSGLVVGSNGKDYLLSEIIERYNNFYTGGYSDDLTSGGVAYQRKG